MSEPAIKLVAFCGSLRKASFNRMALQAFTERLPAGVTLSTIEIGDWPLYNADIQAQGFPDKVQAAQKAMLERRRHRVRLARVQLLGLGRAEERHRLAVAHDAAALRRQADGRVRRLGRPAGHGALRNITCAR